MPPRKKTTADATTAKPASARTTRSTARPSVAKPASAAAAVSAPKPKSNKGKRARADNDTQDDDEVPSKKSKVDDQADASTQDVVVPKKMVGFLDAPSR